MVNKLTLSSQNAEMYRGISRTKNSPRLKKKSWSWQNSLENFKTFFSNYYWIFRQQL